MPAVAKARSGTLIDRAEFLKLLNSVSPGTNRRETTAQSHCFVFSGGEVHTFNEFLACRAPSPLPKKFTGAVKADKLLAFLNATQEAELTFEEEERRILLKERSGTAWFAREAEFKLPVSVIPVPESWKPLAPAFCEAVEVVQKCASTDSSRGDVMCVHIHPKWVEAADNFQLCRWRLRTKVETPTLVKGDIIRHVPATGAVEFAEGEHWIQFRNKGGLVMSCRKYLDDFPDMTEFYDVAGEPAELPKNLEEAVKKAAIFSAEDAVSNFVRINLTPGKMWVIGRGISGGYDKPRPVEYTGKPMSFLIKPELLIDLVKRSRTCTVSENRLKIDNKNYEYVSCLAPPQEEKGPGKKKAEAGDDVPRKRRPHEEEEE